MSEAIRIDEASMQRVRDVLYGYRNGAPKAVARAVNKGLASGQKAIVDGIRAKAALKKKDIRQHITPVKASATKTQNPQARIDIKGYPLNLLTHYGARPAGKTGISFRIWKDGKREKYKHAFIASLVKSRYSGVFEVNVDSPRYKEGRRVPWRRKSGPSVPNIYAQTPGLAQKAEELAHNDMMAELDRQIGLIDRGVVVIIREQIVQAVIQRLRPLTTVPVLRREQYADEYEFVCVWDQTQETSRDDYGRLTHTMDMTIEFIRQDTQGYDSPATAVSGMYGELVPMLFNDPVTGQPDPTFADLAESMTESSMLPLTPDAGLKITGLSLQVEIAYHTKPGDPFSQ